jgi:hypothetical protein
MPDGQLTERTPVLVHGDIERAVGWSLSPAARRALLAGGLIAAISFILHLALARVFDRLGLYFLNDILFGSDTHDFLASISHGAQSVRTLAPDLLNSVHPYVWFYFSPFVRGLAKLGVILGLTDASVFDLRLTIGIVVVPLITALQGLALAVLLHLLGLSLSAVVALALLNTVTFSSVLYGSAPDHFMVTNLAITLLALAAVATYRNPELGRPLVWIPLGLFATGITTTNIAFVGIAYFCTQLMALDRGFWKSALHSTVFSGGIVLFVLASADLVGFITHGTPSADNMRNDFVGRYLQVQSTLPDRVVRAATALGNSLAPLASDIGAMAPPPRPDEHYPVTHPAWQDFAPYPKYTFEAGTQTSFAGNPLALIGIVGTLIGGALMLARRGPCRMIAAIAIAIVLFNLALHSLWGDEYVLYSQHWMTAVVVLLAGVFLAPAPWRTGIAGALLMYAAAVGLNNAIVFVELLDQLNELSAATGWPH